MNIGMLVGVSSVVFAIGLLIGLFVRNTLDKKSVLPDRRQID